MVAEVAEVVAVVAAAAATVVVVVVVVVVAVVADRKVKWLLVPRRGHDAQCNEPRRGDLFPDPALLVPTLLVPRKCEVYRRVDQVWVQALLRHEQWDLVVVDGWVVVEGLGGGRGCSGSGSGDGGHGVVGFRRIDRARMECHTHRRPQTTTDTQRPVVLEGGGGVSFDQSW